MFGDNILQFYLKKHDFAITSADISGTAGVHRQQGNLLIESIAQPLGL